jgi:hypothetical protein
MVSANQIIGSLVYRTRKALNTNPAFLASAQSYVNALQEATGKGYDLFAPDGKIQLWHYCGTAEEIASYFLKMQDAALSRYKFPAVFNYQPVREDFGLKGNISAKTFNLAFVAPTNPEWGTPTREKKVRDKLLVHIYREFIRQIRKSKYFLVPVGGLVHTSYWVPTTGEGITRVLDYLYSDFMDAIQVVNLRLQVYDTACKNDENLLNRESNLVFQD